MTSSPFFRALTAPFFRHNREDPKPPMVDLHTHILPAVDDGSQSWEMTLEMCRMAQQDGTAHMVASPHANERFAFDRPRYETMLDQLQEDFPSIQFSLGCDFNCSYDNVEDAVKNPGRYTIGDSVYILTEFNAFAAPRQMIEVVSVLGMAGLVCIVTHPERLPLITQVPDFPDQLVQAGALIQITANSLTGFWGSRVQKVTERLLRKGSVFVIASDAHDTKGRTPVLSEAWKIAARIVGREQADALVSGNPLAIVRNEQVDQRAVARA
jgi:protein-tyrosine phosphatase